VLDGHKPDRLEKQIRFGCGFVFGALVGFFAALRAFAETVGVLAVTMGVAVTCALLAVRYGDRFWYSIRQWLDL
jgi:hypothetical protein